MNTLKICLIFISTFYIQNLFCQIPIPLTDGEHKIICQGGSTTIGSDLGECKNCCKWTPAMALDDPTNTMPTVSGLTTTTEYIRETADATGNVIARERVIVYVCSIDLDIYKPLFLNDPADPTEKLVNESSEESVGAQTFVNLDSDDNDFDFDINDNLVTGGDDEFIKLEIKLTLIGASSFPATSLSYASIKHWPGSNTSSIKIWKSNDKMSGEYILGDVLSFPSTNTTSSIFFWVEGISGHSMQKATQLFAETIDKSNIILCSSSRVSITILGVAATQWLGVENGYTGNGMNNSNTLDTHVMEEDGIILLPHVRIFPESKFDSGTSLPSPSIKDEGKFEVTLSTKPVEPLPIYLRLIDADDPSSSEKIDYNDNFPDGTSGNLNYPGTGTTVLDYNANDDNRGYVDGHKYGKMTALTSPDPNFTSVNATLGIYKYINFDQIFTLKVKVSPFPGDNYQACLFGDIDFLYKIRNYDKHDKQNIVFDDNDPILVVASCPSIDNSLISPTLTVWRTLHVEYDKMQNPTWDENLYLEGYFSDFESSSIIGGGGRDLLSKVLSITTIRPNSATGNNYVYPSKPLMDKSTGSRRFNNGIIKIGNSLQTICSIPNPCITSNGEDFVNLFGPQDLTLGGTLTCTVSKIPFQDLVLTIKEAERLPGPDFKIVLQTASSINLADYNGGDISVAGGPIRISCLQTFSGNNSSLVILNTSGKSNFVVPIQIFDDDAIPISGYSTTISDINFATPEGVFAEAYIDVKNDGGGKSTNNNTVIGFERNINSFPDPSLDEFSSQHNLSYFYEQYSDSKDYEKESYWVAYALSAWQAGTGFDFDPSSEPSHLGLTTSFGPKDCSVKRGGTISVVFHEPLRELNYSRSLVLSHELGHQCSLTHGNDDAGGGNKPCSACYSSTPSSPCPGNMGIMIPLVPHTSFYFVPFQKHLLRSRYKSPGQI